MKNRMYTNLWIICLVLSCSVGFDQTTKRIAELTLKEHEIHSMLFDSIRIQYIKNTGAFLSFGSDFSPPIKMFLFIIFPLLALLLAFIYILFSTNINKFNLVMISMIIGGGFGNLIDRILQGQVTDFINMGIGTIRTGIWNMADLFIMIGAIGLFIMETKKQKIKDKDLNAGNFDQPA